VPAVPSWLIEPLWDQFAALLPPREIFVSTHPRVCHRRRIADRVVFGTADPGTAVRLLVRGDRRQDLLGDDPADPPRRVDRVGVFGALARIAREAYDRVVGLVLDAIAVDGWITKAPGGGEVAGPSPVDRRKQGMKRSVLVEGHGSPLRRVLAGAHRHDSPLLAPTLDLLAELGPLPEEITVHLDAGYDSGNPRDPRRAGLSGEIAHKGEKAPIQAGPSLARRAHQRLAQHLQPAPTLLRTRGRNRRVLRPRRRDHHRP
jgi:hypothetical protein